MTGSHQIGGNRCHCSKSTATSTTTHRGPHTGHHLVLSGDQKLLLYFCYNRCHRLLAPPSLSLATHSQQRGLGTARTRRATTADWWSAAAAGGGGSSIWFHTAMMATRKMAKYGRESHLIRSKSKHNLPFGQSVLLPYSSFSNSPSFLGSCYLD